MHDELIKHLEAESLRVISSTSQEMNDIELVSVRIHMMDLYNWGSEITLAKLNETFADLIYIKFVDTNLGHFIFYSGDMKEQAIMLLDCFTEILK